VSKHQLIVWAAAIMIAIMPLCAKDQGFSGKWVIDKAASKAPSEIPDGLTQQIKEKGNQAVIQSQWRELPSGMSPLPLLGIMITELKLPTDGSETTNQMGPFMQVSKTHIEGDRMITDWTASINGQAVKGQWVRTLSDDGHTMTLEIQQTGPDSKDVQGTLVFRKK
jgi:hypothetical protein